MTVERGGSGGNEPVATETDAEASTESLVEDHVEEGEKVSADERAEPAEAEAGAPASDEVEEPERETETLSEEEVDDGQTAAAGTDAEASTESLVEDHVEEGEKVSPAERAETAEASAAEPGEADERTDVDEIEPETEEEVPHSEGAESVEILKGIGPSYADRLEDAGVETVADLAEADPEELAADVDLSEKRVGRWVQRAKDRLESHE
ncbi:helix-hairpin-helix domain-containing protein [Halospeciosus flavus]|uniref:helix-hairpin-helix domain-containing protein n=1 Tax=Halospeciosus flavus TaxID=3032283 RepID=UPI003620EF90